MVANVAPVVALFQVTRNIHTKTQLKMNFGDNSAILLSRSHLASLFTPDPEIAAVVANVAPVVALFQVP